MIIETERALAMRCPACGKLNHQVFSLFSLSGARTLKLQCTCGFSLFQLSTRNYSRYAAQLFCVVCEHLHMYDLTAKEFATDGYVAFACPDTEIELGSLGGRPAIQEIIRKEQTPLEDLLVSYDHADYFENREVMIGILESLQGLANHGRLFCQCGSVDIDIDIFPDRVELHCPECDGGLTIYGRTEQDLALVLELNQIELVAKTISQFNRNIFKTQK